MPWSLDPKTKTLEEKFTLFQGFPNSSEKLTSGFVVWNALPTIPKPNHQINSELASIKAEHAKRRAAGAFENNISLANRYANYGESYSDEELQQTLREISSQWEQDIDYLYDQD